MAVEVVYRHRTSLVVIIATAISVVVVAVDHSSVVAKQQ